MDRWERRAGGHAEGLEPPFRRLIGEKADEYEEEHTADDPRPPKSPAPAPIGE